MQKLSIALTLATLVAACGGSTPKPSESAANTTPSAPATEASAAPASTAATPSEAPAASASAAPASAPDSPPAANAQPAAGIIAQGHDECTAIAAPFEEKVRAKFNECYQAGKKKNPELAGTIKVTLKIDMKGKVKYVPEPSKLDKAPYDCMVSAVKKEKFDAKACKGKDVAVSKTFGSE